MHVSLDIDISPSSSLPSSRWFVIRAGIREADPHASSSPIPEPTGCTQSGPQKTFWFFMRLLSREKNEHLDHQSYTVRVPRTSAELNDLSSILLVDLLARGMYLDNQAPESNNHLTNNNLIATGASRMADKQTLDMHATNNDTVLLGRYRISLADLLSSRGQSQVVSIMSLIEDRKLADLSIQYHAFACTKMDTYIIVSIDRPGAKGYLSLCASTAATDHGLYEVVYQDITGGAKTGPTFELTIPYDIILCYASSYGLAVVDKGETCIPISNVIDRKELKKAGLDLSISPHDSQLSIPISSTNSFNTSTKIKQSIINLKYIDKQSKIDQLLYVIIDESLQMRFECLKTETQMNTRVFLQAIFKRMSQLLSDTDVDGSEQKNPLPTILWTELSVPGNKWSVKEAVDVIQSHVLDSAIGMRNTGLSERPFGRLSYDIAISKGIYVLVLSNSTAHAADLHACFRECNSVVFLLFCFIVSNPEIDNLLAQYTNVKIFDIINPNYSQLQHVLLSVCGCICYNIESGERRRCICGFHGK